MGNKSYEKLKGRMSLLVDFVIFAARKEKIVCRTVKWRNLN